MKPLNYKVIVCQIVLAAVVLLLGYFRQDILYWMGINTAIKAHYLGYIIYYFPAFLLGITICLERIVSLFKVKGKVKIRIIPLIVAVVLLLFVLPGNLLRSWMNPVFWFIDRTRDFGLILLVCFIVQSFEKVVDGTVVGVD